MRRIIKDLDYCEVISVEDKNHKPLIFVINEMAKKDCWRLVSVTYDTDDSVFVAFLTRTSIAIEVE